MRVEGNRSSDDGPWVAPTGYPGPNPCTCVSLVPLAQTSPRDRRRNGKAPFAPNATFVLFNIKLI
jgi:hypothetical protein